MICKGLLAVVVIGILYAAPASAQYGHRNVYDPNRTHPTQVIEDLKRLSPERRVDTAMALFRGLSQSGPKIATQILLAERPEYVVGKLADAIAFDIVFQENERRRLAFIVLAAKQEWRDPRTYELLTDGLLDWRVDEVCRLALEQAPLSRRPDAAVTLANRLESWYTQHGPVTADVLTILGSYGASASSAMEMIERIFISPMDRWPENRVLAGVTIARIGGLQMALTKYRHMDSTQYEGALEGLTYLADLVPSPYETDRTGAKVARKLALDALNWSAVGVFRASLLAIPPIYGSEMYVASADGKQLNPELKNALIAAAEKQQDATLRGVLVTVLRQYEAAAARP
jgi:hypothetical protein